MSRSRLTGWAGAIVVTIAALALRWWLDPVLGDTVPLVTLFAAVAISLWLGGYGPALLSTVLGYLAASWLFIPPRGTIGFDRPADLAGALAFLLTCSLIITFGELLRRSRRLARDTGLRASAQAELLRVTLASIGDGVIATDSEGNVTFLNGVAESLTGWTSAAALGRPLADIFNIVNETTRAMVENPVFRVLREGIVVGLANHTVLVALDGSERAIDDSAAPIRDAEGRLIGAVLVFRDVTERRRAGNLLARSESELAEFFQNASVGLHWVTENGTILRANQAELEMLGYSAAEYVGRNIAEFYVDRDEVVHVMNRLRNGESVANFEARMRCRDGTVRYVLVNSNVHWVNGRFVHTRSSTVDITDQKRGESLLREHNRLLELIVRGLSEQECMQAVCDAVGRLSFGTRAIILLTDPARHHIAEVIAPGFDESLALALLGSSVSNRAAGAWLDAFRGRMSVTVPDVAGDPAGPSSWRSLCLTNGILGWHGAPVRGKDDQPVGVVLLCFDLPREPNAWKLRIAEFATNTAGVVLERERAREALSQNERRLAEEAQALARLHASSVRLWAAGTVAEGLEAMIDAVMDLMGTDMGNFQLMDRERGKLRMAAHRGFGPGYLEVFGEVAPGEASACGRALRTRDRVIIEDVEADAAYAPWVEVARAAGYRSVVATPLIGRDGIPLGVVSTHAVMPHRPDEQALRRLDVFIRLAVDFIERVGAETRLREADRRKDEFLATLAHELRNPLAPMRNALALMKQSDEPGHALQARETMDRQLDHMVRLIDDLLDVGRITRDKLELRRERVDLARVIRDAVEASHPLFDEAGQLLEVVLPAEPLFLDADPARMAQVFGNLLTNASKYTDHGGRIELVAERSGDQAVVRVHDNGIGIPPHLVDTIFEMFSQVDQSFERTRGGLGIGLTLARRLVQLHEGTITVRSNGHGAGATFEVRLPALAPLADDPVPAATEPPAPDGPVESRRILVVDDNRDAAVTLAMLLRIDGHVTEIAYDGLEARDKALAWRPDVMILDLGLPGMNGYEVCRAVREALNGHQVYMVALTGWGQESDQRRSAEAGFHMHLVKPVAPGQLRDVLQACVPGRDRPGPPQGTGSGSGGVGT